MDSQFLHFSVNMHVCFYGFLVCVCSMRGYVWGGSNSLLSQRQNRQYGRRVTVGDFRPVLITGNTMEPSVVWRAAQNLQSTQSQIHTHTNRPELDSHWNILSWLSWCSFAEVKHLAEVGGRLGQEVDDLLMWCCFYLFLGTTVTNWILLLLKGEPW